MTEFGKLLRKFREESKDPANPKRKLSQIRLGELMGIELGGGGFSGVMVSYWESGKNKISGNDRLVLVSLLKILHKHGGLKTPAEADDLLRAGYYSALASHEIKRIFPDVRDEISSTPQPEARAFTGIGSLLLQIVFGLSDQEIKEEFEKEKDGPAPAWPRVLVTSLNRVTGRLTVSSVLRALVWLWMWILSWMLIIPSLDWPFANETEALFAIVLYAAGSLIVPALIGALTNTRDSPFWQGEGLANALETRLYTHQGASVGFHVGYFTVFIIFLFGYTLHLQTAAWLDMITIGFPIVMGYMGARLIPHNILRAYKRLDLAKGAVFFIFILVGPLWGYFFLQVHSLLLTSVVGLSVILLATTLLVSAMLWQQRRTRFATIPFHWWLIFYIVIIVCQVISFFVR